ncbi:hypothetical protein [Thermoactinomyces mirandus]|uniref:Uncharacterized protein n=1 Tax=Thermoactinomyces mirandus TaxID=2756294 RepID=A0A7W1XSS4_9BACL|nr:hypothetical protein [Thermoactinomyces mirandus]MBA4602410.1 hypothetical protein [Thermoactinomyces mirandus]
MNQRDAFYRELAEEINRTVGRKAVSASKIKSLIRQAKQIRAVYGTAGLMSFARELPWRLFTPQEIERLQRSPRWPELSSKFVDAMVMEEVITPFEANMIRRFL